MFSAENSMVFFFIQNQMKKIYFHRLPVCVCVCVCVHFQPSGKKYVKMPGKKTEEKDVFLPFYADILNRKPFLLLLCVSLNFPSVSKSRSKS